VAAPLSQHEHWDGSGYPEGLRAEQIPLMGRICAAASAYEALQSERPYRPAFTRAQARAHMQAQAGKQFDPKVVQALLELKA
jgi:putative two-component system response regulator